MTLLAAPPAVDPLTTECPTHEWLLASCPPECRYRQTMLGEVVAAGSSTYRYHDEEQILAPARQPFESLPALYAAHTPIDRLNRHATWVHIVDCKSSAPLQAVLARCPRLRLVQVPPSSRVRLNLDPFLRVLQQRGIGFRFARVNPSLMT